MIRVPTTKHERTLIRAIVTLIRRMRPISVGFSDGQMGDMRLSDFHKLMCKLGKVTVNGDEEGSMREAERTLVMMVPRDALADIAATLASIEDEKRRSN